MHAITTWLMAIAVVSQCGVNSQNDPASKARTEEIVDTLRKYERYDRYFGELFQGPPAGLSRDKLLEWERQIFVKLFQCRVELTLLFLDGPCPAAVKRFLLASPDSAMSLLDCERLLLDQAAENLQLSLLEVLDSEDRELKDLLPKFREQFKPSRSHDTRWLDKKGKQVPGWYIDRLYEVDPEGALFTFAVLWSNKEFVNKNREELEWTFHVVKTYVRRLRYPNRLQPGDLELGRKQLKWLWDTKEWWARRYVVEILGKVAPPLAFEKAIRELENENHPYVKPRIQELQLIRILQERGFGK